MHKEEKNVVYFSLQLTVQSYDRETLLTESDIKVW